ncbi:MAG TPA: MFS transporter [Kofleriaceae bacterium]|nr:MFS transporter [Kofleriaceae bacterium]
MKQGARNAAILASLAFANMIAYAARNELFSAFEDLRHRFALHDGKLGALATAFILPHAIATLLFGWAGDRWDRRRVIAVGMLVGSLGGAAGAFATTTWTLAASRAAIGFGTAAVVPVANSILGQIYEGPRKASRMAIFNLGLLVGGVVGLGAGAAFGFPSVVVVLAAPGIAIALVILVLPVPKQPGADASFSQISAGFVTSAKQLIKIRTLRWLMISASSMAFAAGGYNVWLIDFLQRDKGMTKAAATKLLSVAFIGAVAGIVTGARLADGLKKRMPTGRLLVIVAGMSLSLPAAMASIVLPPGAALYVTGWLTLFFMSWYHAPIAVSVDDLAPPAQSAAAQGLVIFTMHLVGTAPSSWILGLVSDRWSLYTAMWVPTVAIVLAALAMLVATRTFSADVAKRGGAARASL